MFEAATAAIDTVQDDVQERRPFTMISNDRLENMIDKMSTKDALWIWVARQTDGFRRSYVDTTSAHLSERLRVSRSTINKAVRAWEEEGEFVVERNPRMGELRLSLAKPPKRGPKRKTKPPTRAKNTVREAGKTARPAEQKSRSTCAEDSGWAITSCALTPQKSRRKNRIEPVSEGVGSEPKNREKQKQKTKKSSVNKIRAHAGHARASHTGDAHLHVHATHAGAASTYAPAAHAMHTWASRRHDERRTSEQTKLPGFPTFLNLKPEHRLDFQELWKLWQRHVGKSDRDARALMSYLWHVIEPKELRPLIRQLGKSRTNLMGYANKIVRAMS